jgi:hypothetical protein
MNPSGDLLVRPETSTLKPLLLQTLWPTNISKALGVGTEAKGVPVAESLGME